MNLSMISALLFAMVTATYHKDPPALYDVSSFVHPLVEEVNENGDELISKTDAPKYNTTEQTKWIWGDQEAMTARSIKRREAMWGMDKGIQQTRGFVQGWTRGFYRDYDYEVPAKCFDKQTHMYAYYIQAKANDWDWSTSYQILMLMYNIYFMFDYNCDIEQHLYDLSNFCFSHDCDPEQLLKNEMSKVFQVTGSMNALAALYYEDPPEEGQHLAWFDMYNEIGVSVGKISRYTMGYDPKTMDIHAEGTEENEQTWRDRD